VRISVALVFVNRDQHRIGVDTKSAVNYRQNVYADFGIRWGVLAEQMPDGMHVMYCWLDSANRAFQRHPPFG
jgi:hypothetical protein